MVTIKLSYISAAAITILLVGNMISVTNTRAVAQENVKNREEARKVWEQAITAKGGRDRLRSVSNLLLMTDGAYTQLEKKSRLRTVTLFVLPSKLWRWEDYRPDVFGLHVEMYNFETGVRYISNSDKPGPVPHSIPEFMTKESETYGFLAYLLETKWCQPEIVSASTAKVRGRRVDVIHTQLLDRAEGFEAKLVLIDFAFDRTTHLPVRVSFYSNPDDNDPNIEDLSDYTEVSGIKVPQKKTFDGDADRLTIQFNVKYDPSLFSKPPSIEAGPEAWRAKLSK